MNRWFHLGILLLPALLCSCAWFPAPLESSLISKNPSIPALARDLDVLQAHVETHGSVVIQQPSVWGKARLTQYREEFEAELTKDFDKFEESLQGRIVRQDQALVGSTTTIQASLLPPIPLPAAPPSDGLTLDKGRVVPAPIFLEGKGAIGLESTVVLEQKARYLNYLNQIRRTNEGDDTADSPGYSLNLMRIPVSVLPGTATQAGHGAEVTLTLEPMLGPELLPTTFRNLVINDLADQISLPLVTFLNDPTQVSQFLNERTRFLVRYLAEHPQAEDRHIEEAWKRQCGAKPHEWIAPKPTPVPNSQTFQPGVAIVNFAQPGQAIDPTLMNRQVYVTMCDQLQHLSGMARPTPMLSYSKNRNGRQPFPRSQLFDVYGSDFPFFIAYEANMSLRRRIAPGNLLHLSELQAYLREELAGAYKFLSNERTQHLWTFCTKELATAIVARQKDDVKKLRDQFRAAVHQISGMEDLTAALAWAILVDAALLNEHLVQDIRETAANKQHPLASAWQPYYLPNPPAEARAAFQQYVRSRWPVYVFALDPVTQDQNVADSFARRQETQLALAAALANGPVSAKNFTQLARQLDADVDTVAIHRTAVGFSHGENHFGWRFYPRTQTPEVRSHGHAWFSTPSRADELRQTKLEPGIRDCVALVLMPAFVPTMECRVTSSWFDLADPRKHSPDRVTSMSLSKAVHTIQTLGPAVPGAECYRPGDFGLLLSKAQQLSARLPMQNHQVQVPYENTLGGFEMFSNGVTDLAPELVGWYGGPGVMLSQPTTLFLAGDHFRVKNTRLSIGGLTIDPSQQKMLSRQILQVTIPKGCQIVLDEKGRRMVAAYVATPYGVTQPLLLPIVD